MSKNIEQAEEVLLELQEVQKRNLFNLRFWSYNACAVGLAQEISLAIKPIFQKYFNAGFSPVEIQKVMFDEIGLIYSEIVIESASKKRSEP